MARLTRDIKKIGKEVLGLTTDVVGLSTKVLTGTVAVTRDIVNGTTRDNLINVVTHTADIVAGDEIGTARKTLDTAISEGNVGTKIAEYTLTAIHGNAEYRAAYREIADKLEAAENELDRIYAEIELQELEKEATIEIAKLNKEAKKLESAQQ